MEDWEKNPEKYLTNPDGSYILNKDGTPRKKGGRPRNKELSCLLYTSDAADEP